MRLGRVLEQRLQRLRCNRQKMFEVKRENSLHSSFARTFEQQGIVDQSTLNPHQSRFAENCRVIGRRQASNLKVFHDILLHAEERLLWAVTERSRKFGQD